MNLFYVPTLQPDSTHVRLDKEESRHIVRVLRKNINDSIDLTDGKGHHYEGTITLASDKACEMRLQLIKKHNPRTPSLTLATAPTKMNDRYEWFLEKITEIGVNRVIPVLCDHSERKVIKQDRYDKILVSAMKQSLQFNKPQLDALTGFKEVVSAFAKAKNKYIAHCYDTDKELLQNALPSEQDVILLIGPEGDFSLAEVEYAITAGFIPVSLGKTRLRTETAGVMACAIAAIKQSTNI